MPDDFDSILGSRPTDVEDVLGARPQDAPTPAGSSPAADSFFSSNPIGRVMSAFGQGAKQGWGADHGDPLTDSTMKEIQKLEGVGDDRFDYHGVKERAIKSANEAFIRPLVTLGERGARLVGATLGAVGGGVGQALGEVGEPLHNYAVSPTKDDYLGLQHVQRAAAGATSEILGIAQLGGGMEFAHPEVHSIEEARANGVIGEPEGNFYGTREPSPQDLEGRAAATANTGSVSTPPTVHDVARQIAPDVFQEYDNLQAHKNLLRSTLQNLSDNRDTSPEAAELQSKIDDILDKVNGVSSRLTQSAAARLADLEDQLDRHTTTDTPDMAQVRQDLLNADYRARDLSPAVTKAYQEASSRVLPEPPTRAPEEPQDAQTQTAGTSPSPLPEDVSKANSEASDKIVQDAKKKFVNAGRSEEESELLGQLVAQRYLTRARTLGRDPYQLYAQEFPNVRAGGRAETGTSKNTLNQYIGEKAFEGQDAGKEHLSRLETAKQLESEGKHPEEIKAATGWFKSPFDGKWRTEISDHGADLKPSFNNLQGTARLEDILHHQDLFDAYPELKDVPVTRKSALFDIWQSTQGWLSTNGTLNVTPYATEPLSVLLHEIQHKIQRHEGFAAGGAAANIVDKIPAEKLPELFKQTIEDTQKKLTELSESISKLRQVIDSQSKLKNLFKENPLGYLLSQYKKAYQESDALYEKHSSNIEKALTYEERKPTSDAWLESRDVVRKLEEEIRETLFGVKGYLDLPDELRSADIDIFRAARDGNYSELNRTVSYQERQFVENRDLLTQMQAGDKEALQKALPGDKAFTFYRNIAGEIEARDTQARQGMTPEERATTAPYSSEEINPDDVIVSFNQGAKKGSLTLNNSRNTIRLFASADASTAIHELGHQFLEELQKDAETEGVDPMVPADLKVVKDWLGLEDDDKITRRGHEQFARGFERYLREGRAPTSALAKVFRKFKEWLTQIYKKVGDLKAPITDDIRKVFDNMLTHTDQETTIIPESDADRGVTEPQPSVRDTGPVIGDSKSETKTVNQETPGPNTPIEKTATTHLDKAGNIRIDTLNSSDDVNSTLKQIAEWDNDHIAARRGKWTQRDVVDLAESAGLDRSEVNLKKLEALSTQDGIPLAARIWGLRKMLIQSATHLKEMMEGDDGVAYAEALQRHLRIQDTVAGVTAEWGRAGMAFKDLAKEYEQAQQLSEFFQSTLGKTFEQVKRDMALGRHLETPGQISKFAKDSMKPSLGHMAQEVFISAFLSGPITHTSYLISNKLLAIMSGIPETIVKAGIGTVHQTLSGKRIDRAYFGEAFEAMKTLGGEYSLLYGSRNGIKAAWKSFKAGQTVGLSGEGSFYDIGYKKAKRAGLEGEALTNSANNIARQLVSQYAYKKALDEGLDGPELIARARQIIDDPESTKIVADEKLSTPFTQTKYIPSVNIPKLNVTIPLGDILRSPSERLVAPIHSFDRTVNFEMYKAQLLYRRAIQDVAKSGDTSLDAVSRRLAVLHNNVPPEITAQARDAATNLTLMGQGGDLTKRLQNVINWEVPLPILRQTQPFKFISPFVHVFSMIQKLGVIERSPIGLLSPTIVDQLTGKHGTAVQHEAISKMAVGVAAMYAIYGMYQNGDANGNADPDYRKAAVELRAKGLPNSIRMGNMSYSFDRMGAIGSLLKHGIAVAKAAEAMHNSTGTEDGLKAAMAAYFHDMWTNISEEGTLNSFSDIIEAMEGSDKKKADWVENFLLGGIPFGVGSTQVARLVDNTQRAPATLGEKIENKIPGMSSGLLPKYDVWGQPVPNKGFVGVYDSQVSNDPVDQALLQSKYYPAPVEKKILGVELTKEQYGEYSQKAGLTARMIITPLVNSSGWGQLSEKAKHDLMSNAFSAARQAGRAAVLADPKNKDLIQKSYDVLKGNK